MVTTTEGTTTNINCPCGTGKPYQACCQPYILGQVHPPTPEILMRSRYSAYSQANIDYIAASMRGKALACFNKQEALAWARDIHWLGLQIVQAKPVTKGNRKGYVEFIATFSQHGKVQQLHERSEFQYLGGRWYYVAGRQK